jgi:uncharacterized protein YciI
MELERFFLVILRAPAVRPELPEHEVDRLQQAHLDYLMSLREKGVLALNGPLVEQPDPTMRGLSFYRTETADEARAFADADPMVQVGWFVYDQMMFLSRPGELVRAGQPITLDD